MRHQTSTDSAYEEGLNDGKLLACGEFQLYYTTILEQQFAPGPQNLPSASVGKLKYHCDNY